MTYSHRNSMPIMYCFFFILCVIITVAEVPDPVDFFHILPSNTIVMKEGELEYFYAMWTGWYNDNNNDPTLEMFVSITPKDMNDSISIENQTFPLADDGSISVCVARGTDSLSQSQGFNVLYKSVAVGEFDIRVRSRRGLGICLKTANEEDGTCEDLCGVTWSGCCDHTVWGGLRVGRIIVFPSCLSSHAVVIEPGHKMKCEILPCAAGFSLSTDPDFEKIGYVCVRSSNSSHAGPLSTPTSSFVPTNSNVEVLSTSMSLKSSKSVNPMTHSGTPTSTPSYDFYSLSHNSLTYINISMLVDDIEETNGSFLNTSLSVILIAAVLLLVIIVLVERRWRWKRNKASTCPPNRPPNRHSDVSMQMMNNPVAETTSSFVPFQLCEKNLVSAPVGPAPHDSATYMNPFYSSDLPFVTKPVSESESQYLTLSSGANINVRNVKLDDPYYASIQETADTWETEKNFYSPLSGYPVPMKECSYANLEHNPN